jgi:hypothetical protein
MAKQMKNPPMQAEDDKLLQGAWRWKWMCLEGSWNRLHRISVIKWGIYSDGEFPDMQEERISGLGIAVCGVRGDFHMPGIFSRMGLERCTRCCDLLEIPRGKGAPYNEGIDV